MPPTVTAQGQTVYFPDKRRLNDEETRKIGSFPLDYDFMGKDVRYIVGMSVPPLMIKCIAEEIKRQWFDKTV